MSRYRPRKSRKNRSSRRAFQRGKKAGKRQIMSRFRPMKQRVGTRL